MIKKEILALFGGMTVLGFVATAPAALAAPVAGGQITAHWESVLAPSESKTVKVNGTWHAAGESYLRVDDQADVAAYSLSLNAEVDRGAQFDAIDADTSAIPHLDQITSLVRDSATEAQQGTLTSARAAAYQVAIWHFTDDLPIDATYVPSRAIRSSVDELIRKSVTETNQVLQCTGSQCATPLSTEATTATLSVRVGSTVDDSVLRIAIVTPIRRVFDHRQYVDIRINGLGASLCPGETDLIRVDKPATHNVFKSSCEFRSHDPTERGPRFADLPRLLVERQSILPTNAVVNNVITALIPRQDTSQEIQISWPFGNAAGMVFMPSSPSSPMITASSFDDSRTAAVTIDPADFSTFQETIQRTVLPLFTDHGIWGLVFLSLLFVLLLVLKDWVVGITNWLGRMARRGWNRCRSLYWTKAAERKIKRKTGVKRKRSTRRKSRAAPAD
jgi:hypothetical protein